MSHSMECNLDGELRSLEEQLAKLSPSAMPMDMLARMEQAMSRWSEDEGSRYALEGENTDGELRQLEIHLEQMTPAEMSANVLARMESAMDRWHEFVPVEEKVVPFGDQQDEVSDHKRSRGGMFAAAAAMAVMGAATALILPQFNSSPEGNVVAENNPQPVVRPHAQPVLSPVNTLDVSNAPREAWLVPGSLRHQVTSTTDQGVIMAGDNTPHRCIRVDYVDRIKVQDEEGREIEINRPGVDFMLIPVETN